MQKLSTATGLQHFYERFIDGANTRVHVRNTESQVKQQRRTIRRADSSRVCTERGDRIPVAHRRLLGTETTHHPLPPVVGVSTRSFYGHGAHVIAQPDTHTTARRTHGVRAVLRSRAGFRGVTKEFGNGAVDADAETGIRVVQFLSQVFVECHASSRLPVKSPVDWCIVPVEAATS